MRRHILCNAVFAALISTVTAFGCGEETQAGKIVLSSVIPDPVPVDLGLVSGTMVFTFSPPLDLERSYDLEMVLYTGGFAVTVTDDVTGTTFDITQGTAVMTPPDMAGEYFVDVTPDGGTVTITFNNWFQGSSFNVGGDYSATVNVLENDFFVTETFGRDITMN